MTISTQMSLHGFIASPPELNFTGNGHARLYARMGVEQFRKEVDDSFTTLDPTFHNLVMFDRSAERAYARFKVGDQFVASGHIHEFELDRNHTTELRKKFVARRIGRDLARTSYSADRKGPATESGRGRALIPWTPAVPTRPTIKGIINSRGRALLELRWH